LRNETQQMTSSMENDLFDAVREGNIARLAKLINSGCDANAKDEEGVSLLTLAASLGYLEIVRLLVDAGADVNQINRYAQTVDDYNPLSAAASKGNRDIIDFLSPKIEPKLKKKSLEIALFQAIEEEDVEAIEELVNIYKVDVNIYRPGVWSNHGWSILMDAADAGNLAVVKILLESGADPNYVEGDEGKTPIMCAIASQNLELVRCLLEAGANVNTPNTNGKTPLMKAAELGNAQICEVLLEAGANAIATDNANKSVAWYAEKTGNSEIFSFIQGKKPEV
jgi:ankyrin repeat protein